jgi:hypothetical protein
MLPAAGICGIRNKHVSAHGLLRTPPSTHGFARALEDFSAVVRLMRHRIAPQRTG